MSFKTIIRIQKHVHICLFYEGYLITSSIWILILFKINYDDDVIDVRNINKLLTSKYLADLKIYGIPHKN